MTFRCLDPSIPACTGGFMIGSFYIFFVEASQHLLNHWIAGSRQVLTLLDAYRPGKPATFSPEQIVKLIAVACERPQDCGRPITRWSSRELAAEVVKRGIVKTIARSTISQLLKEAKIKPHLSRYGLNAQPEDPAAFDAQVRAVCALYRPATQLHKRGIHLVSTDEKTGIQVLQHKYPPKPLRAGQVARIEHEYDRHGT